VDTRDIRLLLVYLQVGKPRADIPLHNQEQVQQKSHIAARLRVLPWQTENNAGTKSCISLYWAASTKSYMMSIHVIRKKTHVS